MPPTHQDWNPRTMRKVSIAAAVGNTVELYDYAAFGFLTAILAVNFFPAQQPGTALLATFAVFGAAFVARPLGAFIFGPLADRIGRRPTLVITLSSIAVSTALIGVLPPASAIGIWSPVLLVVLRIIQGLSVAGEYSGALTYVAEFSPRSRRGRMTSRVQVGSVLGLMIAAIVVLTLSSVLTAEQMSTWGWRVVFLLALPMGAIGLYIRSRLEETPEFERMEKLGITDDRPVRDAFRYHWRTLALVAGVGGLHVIGFYMAYTYVQSYLLQLGFSSVQATLVSIGSLAAGVVVVLVGGALSDRFGRWQTCMALSVVVFLTAYVFFVGLSGARSIGAALFWTILVSAGPVMYSAIAPVTYIEAIPARVRATVLALGYNLAAAVFAGPALYVSQLFIELTGDRRAPAYFLMFGALLSFVASFAVRRRTAHSDPVVEEVDRRAAETSATPL